MQVSAAVKACLEYHQANSGKNTVSGYHFVLGQFTKEFGGRRIDSITSEETFSFLAFLTGARKQSTRYSRCAHLRAFFNHILDRYKPSFASRSGVPLEVVSKIILRHRNLSTTQRYLGK